MENKTEFDTLFEKCCQNIKNYLNEEYVPEPVRNENIPIYIPSRIVENPSKKKTHRSGKKKRRQRELANFYRLSEITNSSNKKKLN